MLNLTPATIFSRVIILIIAFTFHEFAHAWTANYFGDTTPKRNGRLTLNPLVHLDIMGSLLLLVAGFGWAKPVPVNPYALQRHSRSAYMWVALAGPLSNFFLAIVAAIPFRLDLINIRLSSSDWVPSLFGFLAEFIFINLALMLFNMIPIAPLDGEKVLSFFLPPDLAEGWERIRPYSPIILLGIIFVLPMIGIDLLGSILMPAVSGLFQLLVGGL